MNGNQVRDLIEELKRFDEHKKVIIKSDHGKYQGYRGEVLDAYESAGDVVILVHEPA